MRIPGMVTKLTVLPQFQHCSVKKLIRREPGFAVVLATDDLFPTLEFFDQFVRSFRIRTVNKQLKFPVHL